MTNAIEMRGVHHRLGTSFEIRDLTVNVPSGSIYGFLGPNGSGKTTTIRLMLGLLRRGKGSIQVLGRPIPADAARVLARTGYVPERPHLYDSFSIGEAIKYHGAFFRTWDARRAEELRVRFRLDAAARIGRLSKGEPTDGLDPVVRRDVLTAVLDYVSQRDATVFISSHLVHELERICDWVGVMDDGRLVAEMPMQTFKSGIKRLRVADAPSLVSDTPFVLLAREPGDGLSGGEVWVVRGWQDPMKQYFEGVGARLREVVDLDLEEGFVELLRTFRTPDA
jgi:ABC-2 type transport system ATP-binding protein